MTTQKYDIIRFFSDSNRKRLIKSGVTLEQAQDWCKSRHTSKAGKWFDGYSTTGNYDTVNKKPTYPAHFTPEEMYTSK